MTLLVFVATLAAPRLLAQFTPWVNATAASGIAYPAPAPGLGMTKTLRNLRLRATLQEQNRETDFC